MCSAIFVDHPEICNPAISVLIVRYHISASNQYVTILLHYTNNKDYFSKLSGL